MKKYTQYIGEKLKRWGPACLACAGTFWRRLDKLRTSWNQFVAFLRNVPWKSPKVAAGSMALLTMLGGVVYYLNTTTVAAYLMVNGQQAGLVKSIAAGDQLVAAVLEKRGQAVGQTAKTHDQITYRSVRVKKAALLEELSGKKLGEMLSAYLAGAELDINGERFAVVASVEEAQKVLKAYQDYYTKPSANNKVDSVEFSESVVVKPVEVRPDEVRTSDDILKTLEAGKTVETEYTVQPGDSWWLIARKNDMKTKEVLAGNPGATEDTKLQIGQKVKLVSVVPYITVVSKGVYTGTETIPFDVITKTDYSLGSGQTVVKQQGSDGSKIVTYSYVQKNGQNISKQVLSEQITKQPVAQIVAKGPNRTPIVVGYNTSRGSGNVSGLVWPLRGRINSYYGYRWGGFHTGIDIAGDTGDPYTAAADGTVVAAGWDGGYGKMILIDHGNGVVTRYAHSSQLLVSSGQHVNKGQTIGLVGATGNATGPHLHFEIIVNGETVNPLNYLP